MRTPVSVKSKNATAATAHKAVNPMAVMTRIAILRLSMADALRRDPLLVVAFAMLYRLRR